MNIYKEESKMDKKAISDDKLEQVSGGKIVGTTSYGFPVDDKGNVTFTDKNGQSITFSSTQWENLKAYYVHAGGNPEAYLKDVSIKELKEANLIPSNPLGV